MSHLRSACAAASLIAATLAMTSNASACAFVGAEAIVRAHDEVDRHIADGRPQAAAQTFRAAAHCAFSDDPPVLATLLFQRADEWAAEGRADQELTPIEASVALMRGLRDQPIDDAPDVRRRVLTTLSTALADLADMAFLIETPAADILAAAADARRAALAIKIRFAPDWVDHMALGDLLLRQAFALPDAAAPAALAAAEDAFAAAATDADPPPLLDEMIALSRAQVDVARLYRADASAKPEIAERLEAVAAAIDTSSDPLVQSFALVLRGEAALGRVDAFEGGTFASVETNLTAARDAFAAADALGPDPNGAPAAGVTHAELTLGAIAPPDIAGAALDRAIPRLRETAPQDPYAAIDLGVALFDRVVRVQAEPDEAARALTEALERQERAAAQLLRKDGPPVWAWAQTNLARTRIFAAIVGASPFESAVAEAEAALRDVLDAGADQISPRYAAWAAEDLALALSLRADSGEGAAASDAREEAERLYGLARAYYSDAGWRVDAAGATAAQAALWALVDPARAARLTEDADGKFAALGLPRFDMVTARRALRDAAAVSRPDRP